MTVEPRQAEGPPSISPRQAVLGTTARRARLVRVRPQTVIVVLAALGALLYAIAAALAPTMRSQMEPSRINPDGGYGYTFSPNLEPTWPYVVPSHPDWELSGGDVVLLEDSAPLGPAEPSHDEIRRLGQGRYDLWQGGLWFSTSDNGDPRQNERTYVVAVKTRPNGAVEAIGLAGLVVLGIAALSRALRPRAPMLLRSFSGLFLALTLGVLGILAVLMASRPMPPLYMADSFGYFYPGVLLAAGQLAPGISVRDLGYPLLSALAIEFGSISVIPRLQLGMVAVGIAAVAFVLASYLHAALRRISQMGLNYACAVMLPFLLAGAGFCVLLFSHDEFVINIDRIMAEAPHFMPTAIGFMAFVRGWMEPSGRRRLFWLAAATCAAFASSIFKPSTLIVVVLCAASFALCCVANYRLLRSRRVLVVCALAVGFTAVVHGMDVWVTPQGDDFGQKTLFCNHLDVVAPVVGSTTPERASLSRQLEEVVAQGPHGWPTTGFDGDLCFYAQPISDSIDAVSRAEGTTTAAWLRREFVKGVLAHPLRYARDVARQFAVFFSHPVLNIDDAGKGSMPDGDWSRLQPYVGLLGMTRESFDAGLGNWFAAAFPGVSLEAKRLLQDISLSFAGVVGMATALALARLRPAASGKDPALERALLAAACFTVAFAATTALSHTFDVSRYLTSILPFSLAWYLMSLAYLLVVAAVVCRWVFASRRARRPAPDAGFGRSPDRPTAAAPLRPA